MISYSHIISRIWLVYRLLKIDTHMCVTHPDLHTRIHSLSCEKKRIQTWRAGRHRGRDTHTETLQKRYTHTDVAEEIHTQRRRRIGTYSCDSPTLAHTYTCLCYAREKWRLKQDIYFAELRHTQPQHAAPHCRITSHKEPHVRPTCDPPARTRTYAHITKRQTMPHPWLPRHHTQTPTHPHMTTTHYYGYHPRTNTHPCTHAYHTPKHKHPPIHPSTPHSHARYTAADAPAPMTTTHPHTNTQSSTHAYHPPTMPSTRAQTPYLPPKHKHLPIEASTYPPTHPSTHPPAPTHARTHTGYMAEDGPTRVLGVC